MKLLSSRTASLLIASLLGVLPLCAGPAIAQERPAPTVADTSARASAVPVLDRRGVLVVYRRDGPIVRATMRTADAGAYPLFYGAVPVAWGAAALQGENYAEAYRLTLSEGLAAGATLGLKKVFGRARPYRTMERVRSRSERYHRGSEGRFAEAFPSGHAALSFALATSWSLSHPSWYVVAPSLTASALIATSRLWLGVHYPSDVLAGALLGSTVALGVHLLRGAITPAFLEGGGEGRSRPLVGVRVRL